MEPERWQQIERIYNSALEIEPGRRKTFIAEACEGDESLRKEIESLLEHQSESENFIESSAVEVAARLAANSMKSNSTSSLVDKVVSHYRIVRKLASGGMGVVYKAKDSHLDRFVAIKVLPPERVADPERKARFVQEAKAASALNHPNIITVHDIDEQDGVDFIVMEYVTGKTLDEIIPRKGMKLGDALKYAVQISDALSRAHGAGIIHRDLKPGNIMVDEHGQVKVLDFGLAKLTETAFLGEDESTRMLPTTDAGTIVGTVAYMSPEQAEGRALDARSDIFSFGTMFYEMLTGQRAFRGDSSASTIAAILREDPKPISQIAEGMPHEVERVVNRCLRKDRDHRFQTMADLKVALEELKEESDSGKLAGVPVAERKGTRHWIWVVAAVVLLLAVLVWQLREVSPPSVLESVLLTSYSGEESAPSFSPDGNKVAFSWNGEKEDNLDIYIKQIDSAAPPMRLTTSPEPDRSPAWSPDDRWIAFVRWQQNGPAIMLMSALGGAERTLAENVAVNAPIGPMRDPVPSWVPDSEWLAYSAAGSESEPAGIWAISIETGERRRLTIFKTDSVGGGFLGDFAPSISPDGRILAFARHVKLYVHELYTLRLTKDMHPDGEPMKVADGGAGGMAWTSNGREIIYSAGGFSSLWRISVSGKETPTRLTFAQPSALCPAIARTVPRLAYTWNVFEMNIWRLDTRTNERKMLIGSTYFNNFAAYSPDGRKIALTSNRSGERELWTCDADGTNCVQITSMGGETGGSPHWSPDGQWLAFDTYVDGQGEIYVIAADGGAPHNITNNAATDVNPSWSRDGEWIYFASTRSGRFEIWKVPKDGGEAVQVTHSGGFSVTESPNGEHIYYGKLDVASLFRMPTKGGEETEVLPGNSSGPIAMTAKGVYFFAPKGDAIQLFDPATGKVSTVATLEKGTWGASVSPDDAYIVWSQEDRNTTDLMLVEGFR